jgi:hypothetical protein
MHWTGNEECPLFASSLQEAEAGAGSGAEYGTLSGFRRINLEAGRIGRRMSMKKQGLIDRKKTS